MKALIKFIAIFLFFTGLVQLLNAQQTVGFGVRVGVNIATAEVEIKVDDSWDSEMQDYMVGLNFGLVAEIGFSDWLHVQPELNFIQKGSKQTVENGTKVEYTTKMNYAELPILLKGKFGTGDLKFNELLGPSFGYAMTGKVKHDDEDHDIDFGEDHIKRFDISGVAGLGISYDIDNNSFFLDTRVGWGFTNLDDSDYSDNVNLHNRGYMIGVGYIYKFW